MDVGLGACMLPQGHVDWLTLRSPTRYGEDGIPFSDAFVIGIAGDDDIPGYIITLQLTMPAKAALLVGR
jgi:hypothetical protein